MAIRFVAGRAGSGKTHHCLRSICDELSRDPVFGPRLVLLVPEQASLQMERSIVEGAGAAHRAEVLSFRRLAFRIAAHIGDASPPALTEPARAMVLRHLVMREASQLRYYRRIERSGGFISRLAATLVELVQENVSPAALLSASQARFFDDLPLFASSREPPELDSCQRAKLHDLALIYRAYVDYLSGGRVDPSQHLDMARRQLDQCEWLEGAHLWVDGFASFSEQELLLLIELARRSERTDVTMLLEPATIEGRANAGSPFRRRLFARTVETFHRLRARFAEAKIPENPPLVLNPPDLPRFVANETLMAVERCLFDRPQEPGAAARRSGLEIVELTSQRVEVEYAVARLTKWLQADSSLRFRDVAIIVRDLEPYHDLLSDALRARGIPFFIDRRRSIGHHPLIELVRAALLCAGEDMSIDSVRLLLKTELCPLSREAADRLENWILGRGLAGWKDWNTAWAPPAPPRRGSDSKRLAEQGARDAEAVNACRVHLLSCLERWMEFTQAPPQSGRNWAAALRGLFAAFGAGEQVAGWIRRDQVRGELNDAEEHQHAWNEVFALFDDLEFALGDEKLSVADLGDVLESAMAHLTLGLVPPSVDQVLVGSIERSRHPDIKAAVILGFNDGIFPKRLTEDSILNDDDRAALRDRGMRLQPPVRERTMDEALLVYIAMTRPSRQLVITYSASDQTGKMLRPSPYLGVLADALPGLGVQAVADPYRTRRMWDIQSLCGLRRRLVEEFRTRSAADRDDMEVRARWNSVYRDALPWLREDRASALAFASLDERDSGRLSPETIERLFGENLQTSVSQLESYATCPFQYFARHALRLQQRPEAVLEAVDVGRIHHEILEDFARELTNAGRGFDELTDAELQDRLVESCRRVRDAAWQDGIFEARNAYLLRRSAQSLQRVLRAQRGRSAAGSGRPSAAEISFGLDQPGGLPGIILSTPSGRTIRVRGFIDRVDLVELLDETLGIVIDYKRTPDKKLDLAQVYYGLSLQLPAYLLAIAESGTTLCGRPIKPAGALYLSLAPRYEQVAHPDRRKERDAGLGGTFRPRGILAGDDLLRIDSSGPGWSANYMAFVRQDGTVGRSTTTDVASRADFNGLLEHTRRKLGELADEILRGEMKVSPCRVGDLRPCTWCGLKSVCRVELGVTEARFEANLRRQEALQRMSDAAM